MSSVPIATVLGGQKVLRRRPRNSAQWHSMISSGVPVRAVDALQASFPISDDQLAAWLGISPRDLARLRKENATLPSPTSDRLFRVARVLAVAQEVLESAAHVLTWMSRPQRGLGHKIPNDLLTTSVGAEDVERLLHQIDSGVYV